MIAQLIKLRDYVTRYEWSTYRYPSQYIRLKQENWNNLYHLWNNQEVEQDQLESKDNMSNFTKIISLIQRNHVKKQATSSQSALPTTEMELRHYFLDKLFPLQLKWATSTVTDVSFINKTYHEDCTLKYFLQRFPDIYLMMYYPIFNIKKAPVDGEIIFISPIGIEIIHLIEKEPHSIIFAEGERTWIVETDHIKEKEISPLINLRRTELIVQSILKSEQIDYPITKVVISRVNNIVYSSDPYKTRIIGKHQYDEWFHEKRQLNANLKNQQLKVAEALLKYCISTSVKRPEWDDESNIHTTTEHED